MKLFSRSILLLAFAGFSQLAYAAPDWSNTGTTDFNDPNNWFTGSSLIVHAVPGPGDSAHIFPGFTVDTNLIVSPGGQLNVTINNSSVDQSVSEILVSDRFGTAEPGAVLNLNFTGGTTLHVGPGGIVITGGATENFVGNQVLAGLIVGTSNSPIDPGSVEGTGALVLGSGTTNMDSTTNLTVGQGQTGAVTQNSGSTVIAGSNILIGIASATGTYTINSGAELDLGTQGSPGAASYALEIGGNALTTGNGTLSVSGTLQATNSNSSILVGDSGTGVLNQSGIVNIGGSNSSIELGTMGGTGTYNLTGGALGIGTNNTDNNTLDIGADSGSTGHFVQTAGTLTVGTNSPVIIGDAGTGDYTISGSSAVTADFGDGLTVGNAGGSVGTFTQTGGLVTAEGAIIIGNGGSGSYSLTGGELDANNGLSIGISGGTGVFTYGGTSILSLSNGIAIGATGTFNQNKSITLTNPVTQAVTVASGGAYNLNSGTLTTGGTIFTGAGNFNFAGGNVAVSGSDWINPLNGTISAASTINTAGGNAVLSGNLTGNGSLNVIGGQMVNLSGANSGSWSASISGDSTLTAASVASLSTTGSVSIGSGSTFNLNNTGAGPDTFAGSISNFTDAADPGGTAQFNTGTDKLILSGTVNLTATSTTTLGAGGSLEIDNGTISNVNGSAGNAGDTFDVGNGTTTGMVRLLGNNVLPNVVVNTGSTLFASNITGSVTNNGTLGTFGTGSAPAPLLISGNLTSTGILLVHLTGGVADTFGTAGSPLTSANLSGVIKVMGSGTVTNLPIVFTTGGVTATIGTAPGDLTTNPPTALFSSTLTLSGNDLLLSTVQNTLGTFARTPNEHAVAGVLDPIISTGGPFPPAFVPILNALNNLPASQIPRALEALSGDNLQYARMISFESTTFLVQRMNNVDNNLRAGYGGLDTNAISITAPGFNTGLGRSLNSLLASDSPAFHQTAPNGVNYYPAGGGVSDSAPVSLPETTPSTSWDPSTQVISDSSNNPYMSRQHPEGPNTPGFSEFISGDMVLADLNQDLNAANAPSSKANYTAENATAGISYRFTSHFTAGVLFDYDHTNANIDSHGSKTIVDSYSPGLFGTYFDHGFYANGLFAFGYNQYRNTREIEFLGEQAKSKPNGEQYTGDLDFGYDFHPDKNWVVGPTIGATYTHLDVDAFRETGAPGANLSVDSQGADSARSRLGGHVIFQANVGNILLQPNLSASWQHEYLNNSAGITSSFGDITSSPFTIHTTAPSRDSALISVGLNATLSTSLTFFFDYMADVGAEDYFAQSVVGGFKSRF